MSDTEITSQEPEQVSVADYMRAVGERARAASRLLAAADTGTKNAALNAIADAIGANTDELLAANREDLDAGKRSGLDSAMLDRLALTEQGVEAMRDGLRQVATLPDPVGAISDMAFRPSGIQVGRMRVPLGVVGIIYESRPNVTAEAAALCLKSGNATILRGGSEAANANQAIARCIREGLILAGLPEDAVQVVETTDRAAVGALITMPEFVDVIVPRGGKGLIERVSREATVPVIKHLDGVCHVYVDDAADLEMAVDIAVNSKCQRYGTCNTMETLLVASAVAEEFLPRVDLHYREAGVELRGCAETRRILPDAKTASDDDWAEEYLGPILAIRVVDDIDQAMEHIAQYSSSHTESIVTNDYAKSQRFLREVDSSSVMINASTRFADGFEYGLGAEIGISTDKLHARGPVGLEGLTTQKYVVLGSGQIRT